MGERPMKTTLRCTIFLVIATAGFAQESDPPKNELGLLLGALTGPTRTLVNPAGSFTTSTGIAMEVNYGRRVYSGDKFAIYGEVHFLADPLRDISSTVARTTHDYASLYVTPEVRFKFRPRQRLSPYLSVGGGYSLYENSFFTQDSKTANGARRFTHGGAFTAAGGADYKVWRIFSARGEFRYYRTGNPGFNTNVAGTGQNNFVGSGGIVVRWGK